MIKPITKPAVRHAITVGQSLTLAIASFKSTGPQPKTNGARRSAGEISQMGVEWYLVDKKNLRHFELGRRGSGYVETQYPLNFVLREDVNAIHQRIVDAWEEPGDEWSRNLACRIWAFCEVAGWDVHLRNDCTDYGDEYENDDFDKPRFAFIGTAYKEYTEPPRAVPDPCATEQARLELIAKAVLA